MGAQAGALAASIDVLAAVDAALTDHDAAMARLMDPQALADSLFPSSPHATSRRGKLFEGNTHSADCANVPGQGKSCEDEKVEPYWENPEYVAHRTFQACAETYHNRMWSRTLAGERRGLGFLDDEANYLEARAVANV